jgi:hypothetical protein
LYDAQRAPLGAYRKNADQIVLHVRGHDVAFIEANPSLHATNRRML